MRQAISMLLVSGALVGAPAALAAVDVRQMTDDTIVPGNTVRCEGDPQGSTHAENSYYRRFHLPDHGVTGPFTVTSMTFAIDIADDGGGTGQPMTVRLHSIPAGAPLSLGNLTLEDFEDFSIQDSEAGTLKQWILSKTIAHPNTTDVVLEVFEPDGSAASNRLFFGSNNSDQSGPAYHRAPACSANEPAKIASHVILFATGDEGVDVDRPNLRVQIPDGQTLAGALDKGVKAKLSSGEPCDLDISLRISKKLAHKLDIPRVVGTAHRELAKAGSKTIATGFTRKAKHALKNRHSLSVTVRSKATDDAANAKTVSKSVKL